MKKGQYFRKPVGIYTAASLSTCLFILIAVLVPTTLVLVYAPSPFSISFISIFFLVPLWFIWLIYVIRIRIYKIDNHCLYISQSRDMKEKNSFSYNVLNDEGYVFQAIIPCNNIEKITLDIAKEDINSIDDLYKAHVNYGKIVRISLKQPIKDTFTTYSGKTVVNEIKEFYISITDPKGFRSAIEKNR